MAYAPAERAVRGPTPANSARAPPLAARLRSDRHRPGLAADVCACVCAPAANHERLQSSWHCKHRA